MVVRSGQRLDQAVVQVTLDNTPPQVAVSYPQAGQELDAAQEPQVALQAQVNDPFLAKVEFYVDNIRAGEADLAPYGVFWQASRQARPARGGHRPGREYGGSQALPSR